MNVLLIGGGGREHALGWKLAQSPDLAQLYVDPSNPGLNHIGAPVAIDLDDHKAVVDFVEKNSVDLVVVGPEAPLAAGLADTLNAAGAPCFGPKKAAARLETSKSFMKEICEEVGAPTAAYGQFKDTTSAKEFLRRQDAPYVIKADGLAAGKGVIIAEDLKEADAAVDAILSGRFGEAGDKLVIEEFMDGEEASFFAISDGTRILPMVAAQDHKRAFDGDKGPNTGGMGGYSPAPVFTDVVRTQAITEIVEPIITELARRGTPYVGVIYAGLMIKDNRARLVEINARFGDPECQILMRRLKSDLAPVLAAAANGDLADHRLDWSDDAAALVVLAAKGYPGAYEKGSRIRGLDAAQAKDGVVVFHAGTKREDAVLRANGGRVLNITATGETIPEAVSRAYAGVDAIDWPEGFCRRDIGWRALKGAA
ncbi:MAG: phosphoribosylamine--glycine ligase [Pseudomonadota bacterium]